MNTISILWCGNEDEDEGETDCHMERDKCNYNVIKYDTTICTYTYVHRYTHTYLIRSWEWVDNRTEGNRMPSLVIEHGRVGR